jgi:ornithine carrier protein
MRQIYHRHGVVGFWRGQLGTLIRETGGGAAWFGTYEYINGLFRRYNTHSDPVGESTRTQAAIPSELLLHQQLFAGAAAGVMYNFTFYPADTIKSRMQTETTSRKPERPVTLQQKVLQTAQIKSQARRSFYGEALDLWRQQGLRGFYRGCGITVLRSAPSSALIFTVYEALRSNFS